MKIDVQNLKNDRIILYNVLKWIVFSTLSGAVTGSLICLFLCGLKYSISYIQSLPSWRIYLIPIGIFASYYLVKIFAPQAAGHGTDKVISAIHYRASRIPFSVVPVKIISTILTLAFGGVVGTEGPSVQIGAGFMSKIAVLFKLTEKERKKLVICGTSAALAAVFGDPIAGAIFGVEVLFVGEFFYPILLPAIISGVVSYFICIQFGIHYMTIHLSVPNLGYSVFLWIILASIFFSLICVCHINIVERIGAFAKKIKCPMFIKILVTSLILIFSAYLFGEDFLRTGEEGLEKILSGEKVYWFAWFLKSFLLAVTLSGGGSGGVLTPTFYIGAATGALFANIFGLDTAFFGALGFVAFVAGCVNTPMAAIFLAIGMFGPAIGPYAGVVCVLVYMLVGTRSLYPTQILVQPKSDSFVLENPNDKHSWKIKPIPKFKNKHKIRPRR